MRKAFRAAFMALAVFALAASIASCAHPFDKFAEVPLKITFVETTDIHGAIFPYNFITGKALDTSMAQVATLVAENRAKGDVVLLDNGDVLQGQPTVYYYNFQKTDVPHIWGEVLNYLQYDVATIGNHDIEAGHPVYDKLVKEVQAPMICANIVKEGTDEPYFPPYAVITRQGVKIAILGLTQPKITEQLPKAFWAGMDVLDMVETAKKWVPIIQEKEKPDILIGLFHAGVDYTYGGQTADTPKNENPSQLVVERVTGFDFIFVGHDHAGWDGKGYDPVAKTKTVDVKDPSGKVVPIYGGLAGAAAIPVVEISLQWDKKAKSWTKSLTGSLTALKGVAADAAFLAKFEPAKAELMAWVERPVGKMVGKITSDEALFGDSAFVDLIHRIQLELCADPAMGLKPAQISFAAPLDSTAYLPTTPDGTIKVRDMFSLYKYENFMYTMDRSDRPPDILQDGQGRQAHLQSPVQQLRYDDGRVQLRQRRRHQVHGGRFKADWLTHRDHLDVRRKALRDGQDLLGGDQLVPRLGRRRPPDQGRRAAGRGPPEAQARHVEHDQGPALLHAQVVREADRPDHGYPRRQLESPPRGLGSGWQSHGLPAPLPAQIAIAECDRRPSLDGRLAARVSVTGARACFLDGASVSFP